MAGGELVVGVSADSNNSARSCFLACGKRITFDGGGDGRGQSSGLATRPLPAKPETVSTQISNNSIGNGRGSSTGLLMGLFDLGHSIGLLVLDAASGFDGPGLGLDLLRGLATLCQICGAVAPLLAQQAAGEEQQETGQDVRPGDHPPCSAIQAA